MVSIKSLIENNFSFILLISIGLGVLLEYPKIIPDYTVMILISVMIFFSCSSISGKDIKGINKKSFLLFYGTRFIVFPTILYYTAVALIPEYALGVLLIALMPVGATSTALANIMGGNSSFAFVATILISAVTPFTVPFLIQFIAGQEAGINAIDMFKTLLLGIFAPALLYFVFIKRTTKIKQWVGAQSKIMTIFAMSLIVIILVSSQRHYFFQDIETVISAIFIGCLFFALLYIFGWLYAMPTKSFKEKKTYAICSGANNIALAAAMAFLYFPSIIVLFTIMCEIAWVLSLAIFKKYIDYKKL